MKRTIALKLFLTTQYDLYLHETEEAFSRACNEISLSAKENQCWNRVALHHIVYYSLREKLPFLGSQMICNAIRKVCASYKARRIKKGEELPLLNFKRRRSVHYCARTFTLKEGNLSIFTIHGRIHCKYRVGKKQATYLDLGKVKEAELVYRNKEWYLNVVIDLPEPQAIVAGKVIGIDLGENNLAVTSTGKLYGGKSLRHRRDMLLVRRSKLQSNGSRSAVKCLKRISGKERRRVKETNHIVAKSIVEESIGAGAKTIVLEDLTNIRKRIKSGKRERTRLHRWAFSELRSYIEYKALAVGLDVVYVKPAYTSKTCNQCMKIGVRHKHRFSCPHCGSKQHSDINAAKCICKLGESAVSLRGLVDGPQVAKVYDAFSCKLSPLGESS